MKPLAIWILACYHGAFAYGTVKGKIIKRELQPDDDGGAGDDDNDDERNDYDGNNML